MWNFASSCIAGSIGLRNDASKTPMWDLHDCSDDDATSMASRGDNLECPVCFESFNLVENVPYVLWCGHTLCKNCILGFQSAVVKIPALPVQLPLFISCPWCNLLSVRLLYRGNLKFPRKNFFLLWMLESMNGDRKSRAAISNGHQPVWHSNPRPTESHLGNNQHRGHHINNSEAEPSRSFGNYFQFNGIERLHLSLKKFIALLGHLTAKFPLVIILLVIVLYAIPASAAIFALYIVITIVFALPSFLMLYFAYPSLVWLVRRSLLEIDLFFHVSVCC